jgi:hypothetical protein
MRWYILKTLLHKEALRHASNRGGLLLAALLVTASLVMAAFNPIGDTSATLMGGVHHCYVDDVYGMEPGWSQHLKDSVPADLKNRLVFRTRRAKLAPNELIVYPTGAGAIQVVRESEPEGAQPATYAVRIWHPGGDRVGMTSYEEWFWRESYRYFHNKARAELQAKGVDVASRFPLPDIDKDNLWQNRLLSQQLCQRIVELGGSAPELQWQESTLKGSALDMRAAIATALVMFALFFTCVYLMPSLTCEERERGLLLAQALSPARVREILAAKFFFYPAFGIFLATILAGIHNPAVLVRPFFWLCLISLALGSLGIGMSIASFARTQRSASLGALCYMLVVTVVLLVCQQNNIGYLPYLAIEFHAPQVLHATLTDQVHSDHWFNLLGCFGLAVGWVLTAGFLFGKRGWQ